MKLRNFFIMQLNFILSINSFVYIDFMSELIDKTATASHDFNKVVLSDLYMNALIIFIIGVIPSLILSHIFLRLKNNKLWIVPIFLIYTTFWFYASYSIVGIYIQFFGHTWLEIEVLMFTLGQNHIFIAYISSLIFMLSYLKIGKIYQLFTRYIFDF